MSRIFKRPMFRRGGNVMEGIMTGIQDRKNYSEGQEDPNQVFDSNTADNAMLASDYFMNRYGKGGDPVAQALISGGLRAVSGVGAGKGKFAELATAFSPVVDRAFEQVQKQKDARLGLGVEIFKSMQNKNKDIADVIAGKRLGQLREKQASGKELTAEEKGIMEMLDNRLKKDKFLSTDRPEVQMDNILEDMTKTTSDQVRADVIGMTNKEKSRVAKKIYEVRQGVYGGKDTLDFIDGKYPRQEELSPTENKNIIQFKPNKGNENKFISGGIYFIPIFDRFGTYDGNTRQFTIIE